MKCKNCKHWEKRSEDNWGDCSAFKESWGVVHDNKTYNKVVHSHDHSPVTFENFGCIHFAWRSELIIPIKTDLIKEPQSEWGKLDGFKCVK